MQQSTKYFFLILLIAVLVVPSVALASWWNPLSWGIWNNIFHKTSTIQNPVACPMYCLQNMLCGSDGKNYCNECLAKGAGATVVHEGKCTTPIVGNDRDSHGCIGSAGYTWCAVKNKCLRVWEEKCEKTTDQNISDSTVINAINKLWGVQLTKNNNGSYSTNSARLQTSYGVDLITKGDLNNDGLQDAMVRGDTCGASCGSDFIVIINTGAGPADAFSVEPEGIVTSSAIKSTINSMSINNGVITINATLYNLDSHPTLNLNYKFVGNNLIKVK